MQSGEKLGRRFTKKFDVVRRVAASSAAVFQPRPLTFFPSSVFPPGPSHTRPPSTSASTSRRSPSSAPSQRESLPCSRPSWAGTSSRAAPGSARAGRCCCSWSGSTPLPLLSPAAPRPRTPRRGEVMLQGKAARESGPSSSTCPGKSSLTFPRFATRSWRRPSGARVRDRRSPTSLSGSRSARPTCCEWGFFFGSGERGREKRERTKEKLKKLLKKKTGP